MFDLSLAEIALVVVAALVFIGPKELPGVIRACARAMRAMRGLAGEIRRGFDDLAKESGLKEAEGEIEAGTRLIQGDDGKLHESVDISHLKDQP